MIKGLTHCILLFNCLNIWIFLLFDRNRLITPAPVLEHWTANTITTTLYQNVSDWQYRPTVEPSFEPASGRSLVTGLKSRFSSLVSNIRFFGTSLYRQVIVPIIEPPGVIIVKVLVSILSTLSSTTIDYTTTTRSFAIQNCIPPGFETISQCVP